MTRFSTLTLGLILAAGTAMAAGHAKTPVATSDAGYLTDGHGMTLYSFDNDAEGISNCYGGCAQKWPPLVVSGDVTLPEGFDLVTRKDGSQQVAHQGKPLYTWIKDSAPGQTSGDGVGGAWHIVTP